MAPHEEESWASLRFGGGDDDDDDDNDAVDDGAVVVFDAVGGCARCPAVNIDRRRGPKPHQHHQHQQQPLLELASYRRSVATGRIEFGVLLQRRRGRREGKTTRREHETPSSSSAAARARKATKTIWIAVGDVLFPTLKGEKDITTAASSGSACA